MEVILGYGGTETLIKTTTESPYVANLPLTSTIYIYCDIVKPQIVGDTNAKLLRSVPVRGKCTMPWGRGENAYKRPTPGPKSVDKCPRGMMSSEFGEERCNNSEITEDADECMVDL